MKYFFPTLALAYLINVGCATPHAAPPASDSGQQTVRCNQHPLPEFTLNSAEADQTAVCECVWSRLNEQDREVSANLSNGIANRSSLVRAFSIHFGEAIGACTPAAV